MNDTKPIVRIAKAQGVWRWSIQMPGLYKTGSEYRWATAYERLDKELKVLGYVLVGL